MPVPGLCGHGHNHMRNASFEVSRARHLQGADGATIRGIAHPQPEYFRMTSRRRLFRHADAPLFGVAVLASSIALAAEAVPGQEATGPVAASGVPVVSSLTAAPEAGARAAPAARNGDRLETVVVTARRRSEQAQDVPTAISTVSGDQLDAQRISQVQDIQQLVPSLNAAFIHARQSSLSVRGIGNNPANEGLEGCVGIYLDNVFLGRPGMAAQDLLDIEQLELLRGPQGTLFGKNTTAGVLNLQTRQPTFAPEATVESSWGDRNYQQLRAILSGPLGGQWAGRLLLSQTQDDGWVKNLHDGRQLNSIDRYGARGQLLFKGDSGTTLRLIADYSEEDDTQGTAVITGIGPARPHFRNADQAAQKTGATPSPRDPDRLEVSLDGPQSMRAEQGGLSAELNTAVGSHNLTSITAWRFWNFAPHNDVDFTNADVISDYGFNVRDQQWSQELRLASPVGKRFDYVLGAFYFRQDVRNRLLTDAGQYADTALLPYDGVPVGGTWIPLPSFLSLADSGQQILSNTVSKNYGRVLTDSYALFAQANWHITDRVDLTAGIRGTLEDKTGRVYRSEAEVANRFLLPPYSTARAGQLAAWDSDDHGGLQRRDSSPSGLLTLSWRPGDDTLLYASASQGEKSGGFNVNGVGSGPKLGIESLLVEPEQATNFELGLKHLWQQRLRSNISLFLTRVKNYQAAAQIAPQGEAIPVSVLTNVGEVESRGVEWDLQALLARGLVLRLNGAWNDAYYKSFENAPCPAEAYPDDPASCSLTGEQVQGAPRLTVNAGLSYRHEWSRRWGQEFHLNYAWRSRANPSIDNSVYSEIPAYGLLNASTVVQRYLERGEIAFSLWARNLLDERYILTGGTTINSVYAGSPGTPRTLGATLRYSFY